MERGTVAARAGKVKPLTVEELSKAFEELKRKAGDFPPITRIECSSKFWIKVISFVNAQTVAAKVGIVSEKIPDTLLGISFVQVKDQKEPYKIIRGKEEK